MFTKDENDFVLVDCPGFLDNRGPEIAISNYVNIKNILNSGKSVRFIVTISYYDLLANRAKGVKKLF